MVDLYKEAKERFPTNILIALVLGLVIGYFIAIYTSGGVGGEAIAAPTGFTASAISSSQINLAWTAVAGASSYNIYYSPTGVTGTFTTLVASPTTNAYSITALKPSTTYYYRVQAVTSTGTSARSTTASATTLDAAPKGYHDYNRCDYIVGWACDANNYTYPLKVNFYADGPEGTGTIIGSTTANLQREQAVGTVCGNDITNTYHGFKFVTPNSLKDGKWHRIYAYTINIGKMNIGSGTKLLANSPKNISCAASGLTG